MIDFETFLTELYVMVDDFCKSNLDEERRPSPRVSLSRSEIVALAIVGQWGWLGSERGFYRYLCAHFRPAFPRLPHRSQLNRLMRAQQETVVAFSHFLVQLMAATRVPYEAIDASAVPTRDINRRGHGWLPGLADYGKSNRLGFYQGFHLLLSVNPLGIITGSVWAKQAWGAYWQWDPKETWSLITWIIYAILLHARLVKNWKGKKIAYISIIGFISILITYFGVNYLQGLHSYAKF